LVGGHKRFVLLQSLVRAHPAHLSSKHLDGLSKLGACLPKGMLTLGLQTACSFSGRCDCLNVFDGWRVGVETERMRSSLPDKGLSIR